jgi:hypothetical protein
MIRITCVKCNAVLEIDDGFAGGVCRCVHCRAMQSVPKARQASVPAAEPKALYTPKNSRSGQAASGGVAEETGSEPSGSGLGSSGVYGGSAQRRFIPPPRAVGARLKYAMVGIVGVIVILAGVVAWLIFGSSDSHGTGVSKDASASGSSVTAPNHAIAEPAVTSGPAIGGIALREPKLVYLFDRGTLHGASLEAAKKAVGQSLDSLGVTQQFRVIVWDSTGALAAVAMPTEGMSAATADSFAAAMSELGAINADGAVVTESDEAPGTAAIAQPDFSATTFLNKQDFSNNGGPPGQTFTPSTNMQLRAITVKGFANTPQSFGQGPFRQITLTVSRVEAGDVLTILGQASATGGFTRGDAYQTFTLGKPIALVAGRQYAYCIHTEGGFYGFAKSREDVYGGGSAMQHGSTPLKARDGEPITQVQKVDRTFFINPTGVGASKEAAVRMAWGMQPAAIVLISGKGYDEKFADQMLSLRGGGSSKVHVILISDQRPSSGAMRKMAEGTGGRYREVGPGD